MVDSTKERIIQRRFIRLSARTAFNSTRFGQDTAKRDGGSQEALTECRDSMKMSR
jgi:hypothetical protein